MAEGNMTTVGTRAEYARLLLQKWWEIIEASERFRTAYLNDEEDSEVNKKILAEYVAKLTRLWQELNSKLKNRTESGLKDIADKFSKFECYYYDPAPLVDEDSKLEEVFKLEAILRDALEALKIFDYEV